MIEYAQQLVAQHRAKGLVVDTNLLLLYVVGSVDGDMVPKFHRTKSFSTADYDLLKNILFAFSEVLVTPHILAETSNLLAQLPKQLHRQYFAFFAKTVTVFTDETYRASAEAVAMPEFFWLYLTDTGIIQLALEDHLVITTDALLARQLGQRNLPVINFHHIRGANWQ